MSRRTVSAGVRPTCSGVSPTCCASRVSASLTLEHVHRSGAGAARRSPRPSPTGSARQRQARSAPRARGRPADGDGIERIAATTPAREWAAIARELRERHLLHDVPWSQLAVIVRSRAQLDVVRRALAQAEVPVRVVDRRNRAARRSGGARPAHPRRRRDRAARRSTPEVATDLLLGPFGGLDRLGLRRLRLALRAAELGGRR